MAFLMSYQRASATFKLRLLFAFVPFSPQEGKCGVSGCKINASRCKLNLNYIRADAALCAEAGDASTSELCIVSEIGAKLFWPRRTVCAQKKRARHAVPLLVKIQIACDLELFFLRDVDNHLCGDVAEDFDGDGIFAEGFDGLGDLDLALVDFEVLRRERFGNVGGGDGTEHLVVLAGLARELQRHTIEQLRLFVRGIQLRGGLFRERRADAFDRLQIAGIGFNGELARQKEIAGVAGLDGDDVAAVSQLFDIFLKNDLHVVSLSSCFHSPEQALSLRGLG